MSPRYRASEQCRRAVLVPVPDAGAEQDDIPGAELARAGDAQVGAGSPDREGDLHEAVGVQRVVLVVPVVAGVREGGLPEVEDVPAGVHRQVRVFLHPGTLGHSGKKRPRSISC